MPETNFRKTVLKYKYFNAMAILLIIMSTEHLSYLRLTVITAEVFLIRTFKL